MSPSKGCNAGDQYWRLNDYRNTNVAKLSNLARDAGYWTPQKAHKEEIVVLLHRVELQLLNYRQCDEPTLRRYAAQRRLLPPKGKDCFDNISHKALIRTLEAADDDATFDKFLDLSTELRCMVYDHYMSEFTGALDRPTQPPLARASRLLRKETLPIFYSTCHFQLDMTLKKCCGKKIFQFLDCTQTFLFSLRPEDLAEIQHLRVLCRNPCGPMMGASTIDIKLKKDDLSVVVARNVSLEAGVEEGESTISRELGDALLFFFSQKRQKGKILTIERLFAARRCMEELVLQK